MGPIDDSLIRKWADDVRREGTFWVPDKVVGERVDKVIERGFRFHESGGMAFCRLSIIGDERVRRIAKLVIEKPGLGAWKAFGRDPFHAYCTLRNPPSDIRSPLALMIQLWPAKSKVVFHKGSHLQSFSVKHASTGWFEVSLDELKAKEVNSIEVVMEEGGLSILDARLAFTIIQGTAIIFVLGAKTEIEQWAKMKLPKSDGLRKEVEALKVEASETGDIFIENFVFE